MTTYLDAIDDGGCIAGTSAFADDFYAQNKSAIESAFSTHGFATQINPDPFTDGIDTNVMTTMAEVDNYLATLFPV